MRPRRRTARWLAAAACLAVGVLPASREARTQARRPQLWAVVVGVGNHADPLIPDSASAVRNAGTLRNWLLGEAGWGRDHVLLLADLGSRQPGPVESPRANILPTRDNLDWAFQKWLPAHARGGDLVVVFHAGRVGRADTRTGPEGEPRVDSYVLPADASAANVAATGWSLDRAVDRFVRATSGRCPVVCWLATDAAGVAGPPPRVTPAGDAGEPKGPRPAGREWLGRLARWPGVTAWLAADGAPAETPGGEDAPTRFTRALLAGLGTPARKQNLAAALQTLQNTPGVKRGGFQAMGGVPPRLTVWADQFGLPAVPSRPEVVLQVGHADRVTAVVSSPDSHRVITSSLDSTVRVWSLKDRSLVRVVTGQQVGALALAMSADGRRLVSGGGRPASAVQVVDLEHDHRALEVDQPHERRVESVVVLPDGRHFVSLDQAGRAFRWDLTETPPQPLPFPDVRDATTGKGVASAPCLAVACGGDATTGVVATLLADKTVKTFKADGSGGTTVGSWAEPPSALAVDPAGRRLAVGFADGRVVVVALATAREGPAVKVDGAVASLRFSAENVLAVGHARGLTLLSGDGPARGAAAALSEKRPGALAFSADGRYLAAAFGPGGGLTAWDVSGVAPAVAVREDAAGVSALGFTADSRVLVTGGYDGSVKTVPLADKGKEAPWAVAANAAAVRDLSASPDRRFLFMLDRRNNGQVWDLKERTCRRVPGRWSSGRFLDNETLVMTESPDADHPGRLVRARIGADAVATDAGFFSGKAEGFEVPEGLAFASVALAPDGAWVAASALPSQEPLVCVWDAKTGRLTRWITGERLGTPVGVLDASPDSRFLLTAGGSPDARLWDVSAAPGAIEAPAVTFHDPDARDVTAAAVRPGDRHQVVTGHGDGLVRLRTWREGEAAQVGPPVDLVVGRFAGRVHALRFVTDGRAEYLAAAGDGTRLWLGEMVDPRPVDLKDLGAGPHHTEQINALASWAPTAGSATFFSGGDDAAVKLWDVRGRTLRLRATFASTGDPAGAGPGGGTARNLDWVAYTPDGHFDASPRGRELARFRLADRARSMEQFDNSKRYTFDLGERLLDGTPLDAVASLDEPAPIAVEAGARVDPARPEASVTVVLGAPDQQDVRLYHNNVPIRTGLEADGPAAAGRLSVPVRLVNGLNQFYAMATTAVDAGSLDSRSPEVEIGYDGPADPGQLHVVALGVGDYKRRRLQFADRDAEQISATLHERGSRVDGKAPGVRIVRTNGDVTPAGIGKAFRTVAERVKGRPQDTVVVFLAGHTGVFESQQFCLLLPSYPFPAREPGVAEVRAAVVAREGRDEKVDPVHLLPYALIEANLMRLDALNRLVIVDACQAEAIDDDAQVKQIRRWMEIRSRRARTYYLMAARRGEPALEVEGLRHGLFTYALLRGMGAVQGGQDAEPAEVSALSLPENADFDHDGVISTAELEQYARSTLPRISQIYPLLVTRSRAARGRTTPDLPAVPPGDLGQGLRMQSSSASFPLVPLPAAAK